MAGPDEIAKKLAAAQDEMRRGNFLAASSGLESALKENPEDEQLLYFLSVCQRYQKQFGRAAETLTRLLSVSPDFGRGWQEQAHLLRDQGRTTDAISAYQYAVRQNPALLASWQSLSRLLAQTGRTAEAESAAQQFARLENLPKALVAATDLLHEGKLAKAEALVRAFLKTNPTHVEAMRLLAEIGSRLGILDDADLLLESAIELEPDNIQLRLDYIQVLRKRQKFEAALAEAEALHKRDPANPLFQSHLAIEAMQIGDHERALKLFDSVLEALPQDPATLTSRGHALKTIGRQDEAISSYRAALKARPEQGEAWYALANLKTYRFEERDLNAMEDLALGSGLGHQDKVHLEFALAKAHEDRGAFDKAFYHYERGNAGKRKLSRYDADQMTEELARQKSVFSAQFLTDRQGQGDPSPDPIFIVGLPRAGSTLLEQILASHSQVDGTLELPNIPSLVQHLRRRTSDKSTASAAPGYPEILKDLSAEDLAAFGSDYLATSKVHRKGAPFFTDKMPNNFRHIGLIHMILPNATIIDARRNPMDCCFSGFKQLFAEGQEFTYGLKEIGQYYRDYVDLMTFWDDVLPGKVLRIQYEDVVQDLEKEVRRLLDHCGLPFEEACLTFHQTERSVRTASSEQVRQPLYQSGMDQWRNFEPWLGPLKDALGTAKPEENV